MSEPKFTKGPWRVIKHNDAYDEPILPGSDWTVEAANGQAVCYEGEYVLEADANAHLIAAAPELYDAASAALQAIREHIEQGAPTARWGVVQFKLNNALAKARGES